ncbi:5419_t:CDS:2, partial [Acaulospora morrowiae]
WGEVGDTIGYNPATGGVFFTKNGLFLGNAFTGLHHIWFPTIGSTGPCSIQTNFGDNYDCFYRYENAIGYGPGGPLIKRKGGPPGGLSRRPRPSRSSSVRSSRSVRSNGGG